jgi:hypothetical protein
MAGGWEPQRPLTCCKAPERPPDSRWRAPDSFERSKLEGAERHAPGIEAVALGIFVGTTAGDSLDNVLLADGLAGLLTHSLDDGLPNPRNVARDAVGILDGADEWLDGIGKRVGVIGSTVRPEAAASA